MRWFNWLACRNEDKDVNDIDVAAELTATSEKIEKAREARIKAEEETPKIAADSRKMIAASTRNHFGESLMLGMQRRHGV